MELHQLSVAEFIEKLSSSSPTPGGGSVAALCGALGAALCTMVAKLTLKKEKYLNSRDSMGEVAEAAQEHASLFLQLCEKDCRAYTEVMAAFKMSQQQSADRHHAVQQALERAAAVPLETLKAAQTLMQMGLKALENGSPNALTDAAAAVYLARVAATIGAWNVRINLATMENTTLVCKFQEELVNTLEQVENAFAEAERYINTHLP